MIPKIIHFCWLSDDPYPQEIQRCLDSWKKILPDYEIWKWDRKRFDINSVPWTKEAFEAKKYAFAADYIRLYALYNYGGIYLDSDVLMYKSFDPLLNLPYFIGTDYIGYFEPAIVGTEKNMPFIKRVLDYYDGRHFVKEDGSLSTDIQLPGIFVNILKKTYAFEKTKLGKSYVVDDKLMYIFPREYFNGRNSVEPHRSKNSFCSHCFAGSWCKTPTDFKTRFQQTLPKFALRLIFYFTHKLHAKQFIYKIPFK